MNDIYDYILLQELKKLPRHGRNIMSDGKKAAKAFEAGLDEQALSRTISLFEALQKTVEELMGSMMTLENRALGFQQSFNLTTKAAKEQAIAFDRTSDSLKINSRLSKQYAADMAKYLPGQIKNINASKSYGREMALTNDVLRNKLGLDAKAAYGVRKMAALNNKSVTEYIIAAEAKANAIRKETGYTGALVDILTEVGNLNSDIAVQYGKYGIAGELENAVLMAKKFGTTLDQLHKTGKGMLDIQSTTTNMVEYQVVAGKKLEGVKYKNVAASYNQATLDGNAKEQMDIILDVLSAQGDTLETNLLARESFAKVFSMDENTMMSMHLQQKELNKLKADTISLTQKAGESEEAFEKRKAKLIKETQEKEAELTKPKESQLTEIGNKYSTQTTLDKVDDEREIGKTGEVIKFADDVKAGTKKQMTPEDLVQGASTMFDGMKMAADNAEFLIKSANFVGTGKFLADAITRIGQEAVSVPSTEGEKPGAETVSTANIKDGIVRVNDAILFNPNDKFEILASTSQGSLDKATSDRLGNGGDSSGDMSAIAMAISKLSGNSNGNIGPEIANAIAGMSFVVNNSFDGEKIITSMEIIKNNKLNA